jgi:hypothetical protein
MTTKPLSIIHPLIGLALVFSGPPVTAAPEAREVAVAALSLPEGSDGLLHWRTANRASVAMQLSTRYFSEPVKIDGGSLRFYESPVAEGPDPENGPKPVHSLTVPADAKSVYLVLWTTRGEDQAIRWQGKTFSEADWLADSMKVFNVSAEDIGIEAGGKRMRLLPGKSFDFRATEWREPFPVRILSLEPEHKTLFSSTWRVGEGRRELCFIGRFNNAVSLRSLLDLNTRQP